MPRDFVFYSSSSSLCFWLAGPRELTKSFSFLSFQVSLNSAVAPMTNKNSLENTHKEYSLPKNLGGIFGVPSELQGCLQRSGNQFERNVPMATIIIWDPFWEVVFLFSQFLPCRFLLIGLSIVGVFWRWTFVIIITLFGHLFLFAFVYDFVKWQFRKLDDEETTFKGQEILVVLFTSTADWLTDERDLAEICLHCVELKSDKEIK